MSSDSVHFYQELPAFPSFDTFQEPECYHTVPADWAVIITDVRSSTRAVREGRYKEVNATGVACIAAVLNAIRPLSVPFIFGGDGATFVLPSAVLEDAKAVLIDCRAMALKDFGLDLRIGAVPVSTLHEEGYELLAAKWQVNPHYQQAMLMGDGLGFAERLIKDSSAFHVRKAASFKCADFSGFECRWNEVPSPADENVSLLVQATDDHPLARRESYRLVQRLIQEVYGDEQRRLPISEASLELAISPAKMAVEAKVRNSTSRSVRRLSYVARIWTLVMVGRSLMTKKTKTASTDWGAYKSRLVANTDCRKFDDVLRMVIAGSIEQRARLRARLEALRDAGRIAFGMHASDSSLITCIITDYTFDHIHFLDGSNGGYAAASIELKAQLKTFESQLIDADAEVGEALRDRLMQIARRTRRAGNVAGIEESPASTVLQPNQLPLQGESHAAMLTREIPH